MQTWFLAEEVVGCGAHVPLRPSNQIILAYIVHVALSAASLDVARDSNCLVVCGYVGCVRLIRQYCRDVRTVHSFERLQAGALMEA